jgi:low temperature requirement protein LtrA
MAGGSWWRRPRLRDDMEERRATWLELFLDLVFVAFIAKLSALLAADVSWIGLAEFVLLFLPGWSVWLSMTIYQDRFETDDVSNRLAILFVMMTVAGMAVFAKEFFGPEFVGFALCFIAARATIVLLWLRAGLHNRTARPVTTRYAVGFSTAIALWVAALFAPMYVRLLLVCVALLIDFGTPALTLKYQADLPRLSSSHLPERFGLFVIIVLGESVVSVVAVLARQAVFHPDDAIATIFVILFAFSLWWLYFDHVAEHPPLPSMWGTYAFGLLHIPLGLSLTAVGAAGQAFIAGPTGGSAPITALTAGAAAITFASVAALEFTTEPTVERRHPIRSVAVHLIGAAGALLVALAGGVLMTAPALLILLALAIMQVVYGIYTRARHEALGLD